jgi:hypothetical protein
MTVDWLSKKTKIFLFTMPKPAVRPNQPPIHGSLPPHIEWSAHEAPYNAELSMCAVVSLVYIDRVRCLIKYNGTFTFTLL